MCDKPVDCDDYVRNVSQLVNKVFHPTMTEPDYSKYRIKNVELGKC